MDAGEGIKTRGLQGQLHVPTEKDMHYRFQYGLTSYRCRRWRTGGLADSEIGRLPLGTWRLQGWYTRPPFPAGSLTLAQLLIWNNEPALEIVIVESDPDPQQACRRRNVLCLDFAR